MRYRTVKRMMAVLLATVMLTGLVACGSSGEDNRADEGNTAGGTEDKVQDTADGNYGTVEEILGRSFENEIEISYAGVQVTEGSDYNHGNEFFSWYTDTFNVEWEVTSLTFDNWTERMNTWINADDLPDWSVWNFNAGDAANYVDQGLVKKMPDDWREKYPNLARVSEYSEANAYYEELFGGMYYFFRPAFAKNFPADIITNHPSLFLRTDYAEQAGYDLSKNLESGCITISEFLDYLRAVKSAGICEYPWYNDSEKVGNVLDRCSEASGVMQNAYYRGEDGKYHWGPQEESCNVKETLRMIKTAYDEGLLYPEFYTLQGDDDAGHFYAAGDSAAVMADGMVSTLDRYDQYFNENFGIGYWDHAVLLILTDDEGIAHDDPNMNFWGCNIISPNVDDDTLERILTIWDYGCTDEGLLRRSMGLPGVDWDYDEDGNVINLLADTEYGRADIKYGLCPIIGNMFVLNDDYGFINPAFTEHAREKIAEVYNIRAAVTSIRDEEIDWALGSYSSQAMSLANMTYYDEYTNLIAKSGDFATNYDQWVADKLKMVQPVLDDLNQQIGD